MKNLCFGAGIYGFYSLSLSLSRRIYERIEYTLRECIKLNKKK